MDTETTKVLASLDEAYPPTNPAVLLAAARDAYLNGIRHREIVRLLAWTLHVMASNVGQEFTPEQERAVIDLYYAPTVD